VTRHPATALTKDVHAELRQSLDRLCTRHECSAISVLASYANEVAVALSATDDPVAAADYLRACADLVEARAAGRPLAAHHAQRGDAFARLARAADRVARNP